MSKEFLIATHNMKKRDELYRILSPLGIDVKTADQLGIEITDVDETGETFYENALLKAQSGCNESGMPCVADDSGLAVDYLVGAPGVYSARFAGEHGNDAKNNQKLLHKSSLVFLIDILISSIHNNDITQSKYFQQYDKLFLQYF